MGLIGREIIQSRIWVENEAPTPPSLNYKLTYPITVYDAIYRDMDNTSETLKVTLDRIEETLETKQTLLPAKPANYLVAYSGLEGVFSSIQISNRIPYSKNLQSDKKIPTEKAVGDLLRQFGLVTNEGEATLDSSIRIVWDTIVGRPEIYQELGDDDRGIISQAKLTEIINEIQGQLSGMWEDVESSDFGATVRRHFNDFDNPHNVTIDQIGAASKQLVSLHINNIDNPHNVTAQQIGLGNVDNTRDIDKPISRATQEAINTLNSRIAEVTGLATGLTFISSIEYNEDRGRLEVRYNDGSIEGVPISTEGIVASIDVDPETRDLVISCMNGAEQRINVADLIAHYTGLNGTHINVSVNRDFSIGANINPKSITANEIEDGSLSNEVLADHIIKGNKIGIHTITADNIDVRTIRGENIASGTITNTNIADNTIEPIKLSADSEGFKVIGMTDGNPSWIKIINDMISDHTITGDKIAENTITGSNISFNSIEGNKIIENPEFTGVVSITGEVSLDADGKQLTTAEWVLNQLEHHKVTNDNIDIGVVKGKNIESSNEKNRVLVVTETGGEPHWGKITRGMVDDRAILGNNIADGTISAGKLAPGSVISDDIATGVITTRTIKESAVTSEKIFESEEANRVLGVGPDGGHPTYTTINNEMMGPDSVSNDNIISHTITADKMDPEVLKNSVLLFDYDNNTTKWDKIDGKYIKNRSITADKLFTGSDRNMVLATINPNTPPGYTKVTIDMLAPSLRNALSILEEGCITTDLIADDAITTDKIANNSITSEKIKVQSITGRELFRSDKPYTVLTISENEYDEPAWTKITGLMIEDQTITPDKLFTSDRPFALLGSYSIGDAPEFIRITSEFLDDGIITSEKIANSIKLYGTPTIEIEPNINSNDKSIATTSWIRTYVSDVIGNLDIQPTGWDSDLSTFPTSEEDHVVLGVIDSNGTPQYTKITEDMIENNAITSDKIARDIQLHGDATLESRPSANASDENGGGNLIPDVQWVRNLVKASIDNLVLNMKIKLPCLVNPLNEDELEDDVLGDVNCPYDITRGYVAPIDEVTLEGLTDGTIEPNTRNNLIANDGYPINTVSNQQISDMIDDPNVVTEGSDEAPLGDHIIEPIDRNRIAQIIDSTLSPETFDPFVIEGDVNLTEGGSGALLTADSVLTEYLHDRAVTGEKMFTSTQPNMVLTVIQPNSDPQWAKIYNEMIASHTIRINKLAKDSNNANKLLGLDSTGNPVWTNIENGMFASNSVNTDNIVDQSVTTDKIADHSITYEKLADVPVIGKEQLVDRSVITSKLDNQAVTAEKIGPNAIKQIHISNKSITSDKLDDDLTLPSNTDVAYSQDLDRPAVRNITVSHRSPRGGRHGDIWMKFY